MNINTFDNPNAPKSVFSGRKSGLTWKEWGITIHLHDIVGGKPAGSLHSAWAEGATMDGEARIRAEIIRLAVEAGLNPNGEIPTDIRDLAIARSKANRFWTDADGCPVIGSNQVKAALKESASILWQGEKWTKSGKQTKGWVPERLFVNPDYIRLMNPDGTPAVPTVVERPVSPSATSTGKAALSASECLVDVVADFNVKLLVAAQDKPFTEDNLIDLLECMSYQGLGAERSLGHGTFTVIRFDSIS